MILKKAFKIFMIHYVLKNQSHIIKYVTNTI